jgi:hypothetical protein
MGLSLLECTVYQFTVGSEILETVTMKIIFFLNATPCSLVYTVEEYSLALMMETACSSDRLVNIYQTTRRHIQKIVVVMAIWCMISSSSGKSLSSIQFHESTNYLRLVGNKVNIIR